MADFTVTRAPGRLVLAGRIDEQAHLADLEAAVEGTTLTIDLADVTYINSLGVRDWVTFLRALSKREIALTLERCAEVMVLQMNMIVDARGSARVASFYAPFACDACGWEGAKIVETAEVQPMVTAGRAPETECPDCQASARFADFVDRYFLFLTA
jgi:ABC-type transporter Mla MlaB component